LNGLILAQTTSTGAAGNAATPGPGQVESVGGQLQTAGAGSTAISQTTGAPGATTQGAAPPPSGLFGPYGIFLLVILALWVFLLRSGKGKNKQQDKMLAAIKKGDEIQTVGGVLGKVVEVRDDRIQVKVDESANTKIWFSRSAIHRVLGGDASAK
jgi:preprotein translocase subunit YajC